MMAMEKLKDLPSDDVNYCLLKALLEHAPAAVIAKDIIAASEEKDGLVQLAKFYTTGLILPCEPYFDNGGFVIDMSGR